MTHTVHPYAHRIGILRGWKSRWFSTGTKYRDLLRSDTLIREYLEKKLRGSMVSGVEIERSEKVLRVIIKTARPGMVIGRTGEGMQALKKDFDKFVRKNKIIATGEVKIEVEEIRNPESDASLVAQMVVDGLEKRMPFRRVMKQTVDKVMANRDVLGVKIVLAGRVGGSEMARVESIKKGRIPLQTFRSDIDFAVDKAMLPTYGYAGVKVWIYKGEVFESDMKVSQRESDLNN